MSEGDTGASAATSDNVLVPIDGSEQAMAALPYAAALATPGTTITLVGVLPDTAEVLGVGGELAASGETEPGDGAYLARGELEQVATGLRETGHTVETVVMAGDPAANILEAANGVGASMIVMTTHGRGAFGRLLHGSVADTVARDAMVPVMVVRSNVPAKGPVGITRLVVPVDGSPLAEESLPVASAISRRLGTPIYLIRVVNPIELLPPAIGMAEAVPAEVYAETAAEIEKDAHDYLDREAKKLRDQGLTVTTRVLTGAPATSIIEATQLGDVVVITSRERTGVLRWLMGSVTEQLVREDQSPVILVPASDEAKSG
jgi:nucleotide-binding universal stress UspA family protein